MNILFIEKTCDGTTGGSHSCLYNLVAMMDRRKYQVTVLFYEENRYIEKFQGMGVPVTVINRDPVVAGTALIRKVRNWYRLVYVHRKQVTRAILGKKADLVVINNSVSGSHDIVTICQRLNIPVISYERGMMQYSASDLRLSEKLSGAIAVSYATKSNMENQQYRARAEVIYDGIRLEESQVRPCSTRRAELKRSIGLTEDSTVIGMVGNLRQWKGQEFFVRAFMALGQKYPGMYALLIGGYGEEDLEYVRLLKDIANESEVGQRLKFLGYREDVADLLGTFDVFVHASVNPEPFGMVILEAMYCRVPVIATNLGGPVETLEGGRCGLLIPPRDVNAITDAVELLLSDGQLRERLVSRACSRVVQEFDESRTVVQVQRFIEEVQTGGTT